MFSKLTLSMINFDVIKFIASSDKLFLNVTSDRDASKEIRFNIPDIFLH